MLRKSRLRLIFGGNEMVKMQLYVEYRIDTDDGMLFCWYEKSGRANVGSGNIVRLYYTTRYEGRDRRGRASNSIDKMASNIADDAKDFDRISLSGTGGSPGTKDMLKIAIREYLPNVEFSTPIQDLSIYVQNFFQKSGDVVNEMYHDYK